MKPCVSYLTEVLTTEHHVLHTVEWRVVREAEAPEA
jgi:hypothetical protein